MIYNIIHAPDPIVLAQKVQEVINKGWKPQGGASFNCDTKTCMYIQAVIYEPQELEDLGPM